MEFSIALAYRGWGHVKLNPMVGCVALDKDSKLIGFGFHEKYGEGHAEVNALKNIKPEELKGGSLYVTLEPCSHHGKTPPCAELVMTYPISKLVVGSKDPNPLVAGKGLDKIKEKGIEVAVYCGKHRAKINLLNEMFFYQITHNKCFWSMKMASSLDGVSSLKSGESKWITNEKSREYVHYLRAGYSAIAVGSGTLEEDDPSLDVRHPEFSNTEPKLLLFSRKPNIEKYKNKKIFEKHKIENIYWICQGSNVGMSTDESGNQKVTVNWEEDDSVLKLSEFLYQNLKIGSVFVEPGHGLFKFFLDKKIAQRFYHFQSSSILGGGNNQFSRSVEIEKMSESINLDCIETKSFDSDFLRVFKI